MTSEVLDASALLALVNGEPGADRVRAALHRDAAISTVNLAEVISKLVSEGMDPDDAVDAARVPRLQMIDLDTSSAVAAGLRHAALRKSGFSLADAICLETARAVGAKALTTDRIWARASADFDVELIR